MDQSPRGAQSGLSRRGLFKGGLIASLGAAGLGVTSTALSTGVARASQNASIDLYDDYETNYSNTEVQEQWSYCDRCRNLWYTAEAGDYGACVYEQYMNSGISHSAGSTDYGVIINNPGFDLNGSQPGNAYMQSPWYWCNLCLCLFWGGGQSQSWCANSSIPGPGDGQFLHSSSGSGVYYMPCLVVSGAADPWSASGATLQSPWRYCDLCKCLYWGNAQAESYCNYQLQKYLNSVSGTNSLQHASGGTTYYLAMMPS